MNEKYLVFMGYYFYPNGGWKDFEEEFNDFDLAISYIKNKNPDYKWAQIAYKGEIILEAEGISENYIKWEWEFSKIQQD